MQEKFSSGWRSCAYQINRTGTPNGRFYAEGSGATIDDAIASLLEESRLPPRKCIGPEIVKRRIIHPLAPSALEDLA